MKATKAFLEYLLIFLISFLSIDLIVSNTTLNLKNKNCNKIEKFYLELKKIVQVKKRLDLSYLQ